MIHNFAFSGGVTFIEEIPKNPSGKILRRKLKSTYMSS
jgi:acyl-coenzyme A synthetase/AMP-(fatty) acid ligase